ncbi:MAG: 4-alpha-glucanotransferase [Prevotellaceae bacterium]|jgi:4-alpha-glucanotransferase|nr:4-alpha-glucanotransferase [Prevotellaceae bacterium]
MKITFNVICKTVFGQNLFVNIAQKEIALQYTENFLWRCEVEIPLAEHLQYSYIIKNQNVVLSEDREEHILEIEKDAKNLVIFDEFLFLNFAKPFYTKPFSECYFSNQKAENQILEKKAVNFDVELPALEKDLCIGISGNCEKLGNWNDFLPLKRTKLFHNFLSINFSDLPQNFEFKFLVFNKKTNQILRWENSENRTVRIAQEADYLQYSTQFRGQNQWKAAGVAVPVFSLRSGQDWGVGEFSDLKLLADWAVKTEQKIIQILPINDTTATYSNSDSYPYKANSVYALHPLYLNVLEVGKLADKTRQKFYEKERKKLNIKPFVDYAAVYKLKWAYLSEFFTQKGIENLANDDFREFFSKNSHWLLPYAVFCCMRDSYGTLDFEKWGDFAVYSQQKINDFAEKNAEKVGLYYFAQFHLAKQLSEARQYLHSHGVALKGDLPIGISAQSVDAWISPSLFNLAKCAGAPPDDFSETGQNWFFPTYNWENMAKDGYNWWKQRFANMAEYFDAFRIDHILGFFRIWEIPKTAKWGLLGYFNPALPLSINEIESYGVKFDVEHFTKPFITQDIVNQLFGENCSSVVEIFFDAYSSHCGNDLLRFKKAFDTQQKLIQNFPKKKFKNSADEVLKNLLRLHCEVIFIEDLNKKNHFHPRISLLKSYACNSLQYADKQAFERLYNEFYFVRHNEFWRENALRKLPILLSATNMLVCGEDLGMVPDSVPEVMQKLHILSLEIQRMPKNPAEEFINSNHTPYFSVCSTGTHDMSPIRAWWVENNEQTQRFYNSMLQIYGAAPENCTPEIVEKIVSEQFRGNSMFAIIPLQDYMAMESSTANPDFQSERINNPDNPDNFWCYRMHLTLEELLQAEKLNNRLKMCVEYNR